MRSRPLAVAPLLAALALAAPPTRADEAPNAGLERLKALAGEWEGTATGHGKPLPTVATVRVVSAGSAVMLVTDPGTPHEMVTMFHANDGKLLATHYCAAQNQPRMRAVPSKDPSKLAFEFVDGTNLAAHPGHMKRLVMNLAAPDRQVQEWTFVDGGKESTSTFELARKR